jgi:4-amino-4-deoxy-L-arabinose transferase-like glycosyltransferase
MPQAETGDRPATTALASQPDSNLQLFLHNTKSLLRGKGAWSLLLAIALGLALRILWVIFYQDFDGDSEVYGTIAKNLLVHHAYALDNPFHLTLIRLPGYPVFMAAIFAVFGMKNYNAVCWVQAFMDMGTCLLVAGFVRDHVSRRAALVALWIACLCPFTANYAALPMTECPTLFSIALGLFAAGRLVRSINTRCSHGWIWFLLTLAALIGAISLRPDGILLAAAIVPGIWWYTRKTAPREGLRAALLCAVLTALPLVPWTIRNYCVYHVFQPLAPRTAMDPTESSLDGFDRWTTTWEIDYSSLGEIWWRGDSETMDIGLLPSRAFDSEEEYQQTAKLFADYNELCTIPPEIDARFEALAEQRIHRHPLRQYVELPLLRLASMWFRPRIEYLNDAVPERWWEWRKHPRPSLFAAGYALLSLMLLVTAAVGFARRRVPFQAMLLVYVLLRCAMLLKIPNAEPRYTLEAFPLAIVAAAVALSRERTPRSR